MGEPPRMRNLIARTFGSKILVAGLGAAASVVLARALGPTGRGAYAVAVAYASVAMILGHLSVEQAHIGAWSDEARRPTIVASTRLLGVANGAWATVLALLLAPIALGGLDRSVGIALTGVIPLTVVLYLTSVWVLRGMMKRVNTARVLSAVAQLGLLAGLALVGRLTVEAVVGVWVGVAVLHAALLLRGFGGSKGAVDRRALLDLELTGARYHLGSMATFLLWRIDVLVLAALSTNRQVGLYSLAVTVAELVYLVTDSIAQVTLPRRLEGSLALTVETSARVARLSTLAALGIALALAATAPFLIPVVYGQEFAASVPALLALTPGVVALAASKPLGAVLVRCHRPMLVSAINLAGLAVNLALNFLLIPRFAAVGAALASTAAYGVLALLSMGLAQRLAGLRPGALIPRWSEVWALSRRQAMP